MAVDLTTWATVQTRFSLDASDETEIERLISLASVRAETVTNRVLGAADVTRYYDGNGRDLLDLREYPVNSVTSVHVDQDMDFEAEDAVTDYKVLTDLGMLYRSGGWTAGTQNIKVVANVGYSTVPEDLEESVIQLVGYWHQSTSVTYLEGDTGTPESYQNQYTGQMDIPFQVHRIWSEYRRERI